MQRLQILLVHYHHESAEMWGAFTTFLWGLWVLNPWVNTFGSSPGFVALSALASEEVWGVIVMLVGASQLIGLYYNFIPIRRWATFLCALLWIFFSVKFIQANPASTSSIIYPCLALSQALAYLRMTRDVTI